MTCVVVFGREVVPGRVKTRLAAELGDGAAAEVYRALLEHTLRVVREYGVHAVLSLAEGPSGSWRAQHGLVSEVQSSGSLGERMAEAFARRFAEGRRRVVLVGSDCPALDGVVLRQAFAALERTPVVLGPAADGGYWLVGQRAPGVDLFAGVPWSSPLTCARTRERLAAQGVACSELERLADLDTVGDLADAAADPRVSAGLRLELSRIVRGRTRAGR